MAVRNPRGSTSDLLTWTEAPPPPPPSSFPSAAPRSRQPSDGIEKVLHGGQVTDDEAQTLLKAKPCSDYKLKEINGSGIFTDKGDEDSQSDSAKFSKKVYQQTVTGISQISFSADGRISPKKPTSIPEVAKQRELSGNLKSDSDSKTQKQISNAKSKELTGHDIFGPPPEVVPRSSLAASRSIEASKEMGEPTPRNVRTSVKVSNPTGGQSNILFGEEPIVNATTKKKIHNQKFAELKGNNIFKGDASPGSAEKPLSMAKMREMSGSDIFADGKARSRDYLGGVRKPPGGESSISLV